MLSVPFHKPWVWSDAASGAEQTNSYCGTEISEKRQQKRMVCRLPIRAYVYTVYILWSFTLRLFQPLGLRPVRSINISAESSEISSCPDCMTSVVWPQTNWKRFAASGNSTVKPFVVSLWELFDRGGKLFERRKSVCFREYLVHYLFWRQEVIRFCETARFVAALTQRRHWNVSRVKSKPPPRLHPVCYRPYSAEVSYVIVADLTSESVCFFRAARPDYFSWI